MKKLLLIVAALTLVLGMSVTAYAAPKKMADGQMFDTQYYAATYPDVAKALGTSEKALYNHYLNYGKAEGRKPYNEATVVQQKTQATSAVQKKNDYTGATFNGETIVARGEKVRGYNDLLMISLAENFPIDALFETKVKNSTSVYVVSGNYICKFFEGNSGTAGQAVLWGIGQGNPLVYYDEPTPAVEGKDYWRIQ